MTQSAAAPSPDNRFAGRFGSRFRLDGKTALITGGSRGIGLECAEALAEFGARVVLFARRPEFFDSARTSLPDALCITGDVANQDDVQRAVKETNTAFGAVDILINAAGISWSAPALEMPVERFRQVMEVNVTGAFMMAQAVAPSMRERGYGKILSIASVAGLKAEPTEIFDAVGYSTSKAALIHMTRDLAMKWGRYGIHVNVLAPGFFPTRLTEKVLPKIADSFKTRNAMGRPGQAGEIGPAALFFCSAASDYINGDVMVINGGPA